MADLRLEMVLGGEHAAESEGGKGSAVLVGLLGGEWASGRVSEVATGEEGYA